MLKIEAKDFNLEATLESGQVFGFRRAEDGAYEGNIGGHAVRLRQKNGILHTVGAIHELPLREYFDLARDLSPVYAFLQKDEMLLPALKAYRGMRLIRQNSWEALACFIISSNNNVKRIQGIWKNLIQYFKVFPTAKQITGSHEGILRELGLGYRAPFLMSTARFIASNPNYLEHLRTLPYEEAVERVIAFPGIGPKVADCALLYGFQKFEAFPVDVWILRVMRKIYFRNRKVSEKKVQAFGQKRWGPHAGYVQQYLFHSAKNSVI